jgi:hypothetical protein
MKSVRGKEMKKVKNKNWRKKEGRQAGRCKYE